ncbi:MAG: Gldg family protein [Clostridia bacterium]|nr:Gldg family protein [Clostridia bacterium]
MKIFKGKSKRTKLFTLVSLALIALLFGLNLLLSIVGQNNLIFLDLTPEELYTVSDRMFEECEFINDLSDKKVKITFCTDSDYLIASTTTRATYFMALSLEKKFDNLEVETVNVTYNPTAVAKYKTTSLSVINPTDVIVSYGDRYRIVGAESFWTVSDGEYWSYNGEYKLATVMKSVTLANDKNPTAYFLTGHGETYYDFNAPDSEGSIKTAVLKDLLTERGLVVKTLDINAVDEIPKDCALLIINDPTIDFVADKNQFNSFAYVSDTEKIDRYLTKNQGALIVAKDPSVSLPIFEDFLSEWGFEFSNSVLKDTNTTAAEDAEGGSTAAPEYTDTIISVYNTDNTSYGHAIYGDFADLVSAPKTVFKNSGYIDRAFGETSTVNEPGTPDVTKRYASFLTTPLTSQPFIYNESQGIFEAAGAKNAYDLAAVVTRSAFDSKTAEYTYSYVFCVNSIDFFDSTLLGNSSYANYDIVSALVNNMARMDIYASTDLGGTSLNTEKYGGKQLVSLKLSATEDTYVYSPDGKEILKVNKAITQTAQIVFTVLVAVLPVAVLITGILISIKRKFL